MAQLNLNFEPGLAERWRSLKACVRERVFAHPKPLKSIAADMDLSESELSRKLADNPNDTRNLTCDDLESYMSSTGDLTPLFYLNEKYAVDKQTKQAHAAAEIVKQLPHLIALAKTMGAKA